MQWAPTLFVAAVYGASVASAGSTSWSDLLRARSLRRILTLLAIIGVMALSTLYNIGDAPLLGKLGWTLLILGSAVALFLGYALEINQGLLGVCCLLYPPVMFVMTGGLSAHLHEHTVKWLLFIVIPSFVVSHLPRSVRTQLGTMAGIYSLVILVHWVLFGDMYLEWYRWYDDKSRVITSIIFGVMALVLTYLIFLAGDAAFKWLFRRKYSWYDIVRGYEVKDAIAAERERRVPQAPPPQPEVPLQALPPHILWQREDSLER